MKRVSKETVIRTVVLVVALINQCLVVAGKSILPIDDSTIENAITLAFTVGASLVAWWKNNSFTQAALKGDEVMKAIKANQ